MTLEEWKRIEKQERANERYYEKLAKWYEPYDREGNPIRKGLPGSLAEFRKARRNRRRGGKRG